MTTFAIEQRLFRDGLEPTENDVRAIQRADLLVNGIFGAEIDPRIKEEMAFFAGCMLVAAAPNSQNICPTPFTDLSIDKDDEHKQIDRHALHMLRRLDTEVGVVAAHSFAPTEYDRPATVETDLFGLKIFGRPIEVVRTYQPAHHCGEPLVSYTIDI